MRKALIMAVVTLMFNFSAAQATLLDPAVMDIGNPPQTGTYLFGSEVRPIPSTQLGILENGSGQPTLVDPLLLILGVPNSTTFTLPTITLSAGTGTVGGTNAFGGTWNTTTGFAGSLTSTNSDVYGVIGLNANNSNSFVNWAAADLAANGITATNFGIYVYTLTGTGITGGSTVNVTFGSPLANGIFAIAYGQDTLVNPNMGDIFSTPFTESGLTTGPPVPEPGTILLLGAGFLGLAVYGKRRQNA